MLHCIERTEVKNVVALQNWDQIAKAGALTTDVITSGECWQGRGVHGLQLENLLRAAKELKVPLLAHVGEQRGDVNSSGRHFRKCSTVLQDFTAVRPDTVFVHLNT